MNAFARVSRIIVRRVSSGLEAIPGIDVSRSLDDRKETNRA
jgi:hypothetical protein